MSNSVSRRSFLQQTAAGVAGLALTNSLSAADVKDPFGGFIMGIQSYTFRKFKLEQALKRIQDLGIKYAEFFRGHVPVTDKKTEIDAVLKLCKDYGITPIAFGVERFTKEHDKNKAIFEFAKAFGIKTLSADPDPDSFESLDKLCAEYKVAIGIHPHGPSGGKLHRWSSAEVIMKAVKDHHPLIGTVIDTGHIIRVEQIAAKLDPAKEVLAMGARNFGMHLKDHDNKTKRDVIFGQGQLDMVAVLKSLKEVKFTGHLSIEYEHNPDDPSADVKACIDIVKAAVAKVG